MSGSRDPYDLRTFLGMVPRVTTGAGGIGLKKHKGRQKAGARRWEELRDHKLGPCRICEGSGPTVQLHHLVPRAQLGADTESNLVPLCPKCHDGVTRRNREDCAQLRQALTDAEYAYAVDKLGESTFEAYYPVEYTGG